MQGLVEHITFADFNLGVELFSPLLTDKMASEMSGSNLFPLKKCPAFVEFVPAAIIMADLLTQECDFVGVPPHLLKHLGENSGECSQILREKHITLILLHLSSRKSLIISLK